MKKRKHQLSLKKIKISKLTNLHIIRGGAQDQDTNNQDVTTITDTTTLGQLSDRKTNCVIITDTTSNINTNCQT